jgi:hypothetical protein
MLRKSDERTRRNTTSLYHRGLLFGSFLLVSRGLVEGAGCRGLNSCVRPRSEDGDDG